MLIHAIRNVHPSVVYIEMDGGINDPIKAQTIDYEVINLNLEAVTAEVGRLQAEYDNAEYQRSRAADYPSIADQLDTLYHGGIDAWKAEVKVVKDKYPKD